MAPTAARIQQVFDLVDREVWIVTAADGKRAGGLVATWVSAASIDPDHPTVVVGLAPNHFTTELVASSGAFTLHLLAQRHLDLVWRFALASGRDTDKLAGLAHRLGATGSPILEDCLAWLDCRAITRYDAGDRLFFWADVVDGHRRGGGAALREKDVIAAATPEQRAALVAARTADVSTLLPLRTMWQNRVADNRDRIG